MIMPESDGRERGKSTRKHCLQRGTAASSLGHQRLGKCRRVTSRGSPGKCEPANAAMVVFLEQQLASTLIKKSALRSVLEAQEYQ